jgi:phosphoglycolate phosphatase
MDNPRMPKTTIPNTTIPKTTIHGILFDKDGTLFDFQATWKRVIEAVLDTLAPDRDTWSRMARAGGYHPVRGSFLPGSPVVAGTTSQIAQLWSGFRPDLGATKIERILDDAGLDALADPAALFPTAADLPGLLAGLRACGYALGIATHDSEQGARIQLGAVGAHSAFDFIAGYDSGHGLKPGPGMLLAFAAAAGLAPASIAMVGDSRHDLEVAHSAGAAMAIGVLTGPASREDLSPYADHILPSIEHLPALLARLSA